MLIKINTMKYEKYLYPQWKPDTFVILNPESIVLVTYDANDDMYKIKCADATVYWVNADEYARLEPLLLNTPAPVAAVPAPSPVTIEHVKEYLYTFALQDCAASREIVRGVDVNGIAQDLIGMFRTSTPAAALPANTIAAYRVFWEASMKHEAARTSDEVERLFPAMDMARNALIESISQHMPAVSEEPDNE
jgi:hypothetical protein